MKGKLIVIEGTDCSGKETQSKKLIERLEKENIKVSYFSFPCYDSPTGKIIAGPYLGKEQYGIGFFPETAPLVDPKVSSLYYAADRRYNISKVNELLNKGINVILDRYFYSNMAHQGGKIVDDNERKQMYKWLETLEINLLELPVPDIKIFLHVPNEVSKKLKESRCNSESLDQNEANNEHLISAEKAYLEIAEIYNFNKIECTKDNELLTIDEINDNLYEIVKKQLS